VFNTAKADFGRHNPEMKMIEERKTSKDWKKPAAEFPVIGKMRRSFGKTI